MLLSARALPDGRAAEHDRESSGNSSILFFFAPFSVQLLDTNSGVRSAIRTTWRCSVRICSSLRFHR